MKREEKSGKTQDKREKIIERPEKRKERRDTLGFKSSKSLSTLNINKYAVLQKITA